MNKDLKDRIFDIPQDVITHLNHYIAQNEGGNNGVKRAKVLVRDGKVKYGKLKRILHDLLRSKETDINKYNLYGGKPMEDWGWQVLGDDRDLIETRKKSKQRTKNITGLGKNSFKKTHSKKPTFIAPANPLKSNSDSTSFSTMLPSMKLFEQEIKRIKELMI